MSNQQILEKAIQEHGLAEWKKLMKEIGWDENTPMPIFVRKGKKWIINKS